MCEEHCASAHEVTSLSTTAPTIHLSSAELASLIRSSMGRYFFLRSRFRKRRIEAGSGAYVHARADGQVNKQSLTRRPPLGLLR